MGLLKLFRRRRASVPTSWQRTPPPEAVFSMDEYGQRSQGDVPYLLPKDDREVQRLDYQHFVLRQMLKGNTFAPVHNLLSRGTKVLDVGCGTGRWAHEIARDYPQTQVIGFDKDDLPHIASTPLNFQLYRGNLLDGLPFPAKQFGYVHQRLLVAGLPVDHWLWVIGELRRVTIPNGWVELVEMGNGFHDAGPVTQRFLEWWIAIAASRKIDASRMSQIGELLRQAGLVRVKYETRRLPVGAWGGRIGNLLARDMLAGWPTMKPFAQELLGVDPSVFDTVMGQLEAEWNMNQTTYEVYFACGQVL